MRSPKQQPPSQKTIKQGIIDLSKRSLHRLQEGWYASGDPESQQRASLVKFNLSANVIANLIGGNFYTGFLLILEADDAFIGLCSIFVYLANLLQLFSPYVMERLKRKKPAVIALRAIMHVFNILIIGLIPFFSGVAQVRLTMMAVCVLIVNSINAFISPAMNIWHISHVPENVRVSYFSTTSLLNGVCVALLNLLAAQMIDWFKAAQFELYGLSILRCIALAVAVYDIYLLSGISELPPEHPSPKIRILDLLTKPWKEKLYLKTIAVIFLWNFVASIPGSYYTVYLLKNVEISYSFINLISFFNVPVLVLFMPFWRKYCAKSSWLKPLSISLLLFSPHYILLGFVTKQTTFLYPIAVIWSYFCSVGINLTFCSVAYINIPKENQTLYVGFSSTVANFAALLGAWFGRTLVTSFENVSIRIGLFTFTEKQLLVILVGILMFGASWMVRAIWKKNLSQHVEA